MPLCISFTCVFSCPKTSRFELEEEYLFPTSSVKSINVLSSLFSFYCPFHHFLNSRFNVTSYYNNHLLFHSTLCKVPNCPPNAPIAYSLLSSSITRKPPISLISALVTLPIHCVLPLHMDQGAHASLPVTPAHYLGHSNTPLHGTIRICSH